MKCAGCLKHNKNVNSIKCTHPSCEKSFCSLCINPDSIAAERKKIWKCPDCCAEQKKGGDNSLTPIRLVPDTLNVTTRRKAHSASDSTEPDLKELTKVIARLTGELATITTKLNDAISSLSHCHERMDEIASRMSANDARLQKLEKRSQEASTLEATVAQLQNDLNVQAQINLLNEIEIIGIPENTSENLEHIVKVVAQKVGVPLDETDVDWITRVGPRRSLVSSGLSEGSRSMPRPIVVRLLRRSKRDQLIRASRSRRNLSSTDLEIAGAPVRVFINERLTKESRVLFRETRARTKKHGYAYCWCSQGTIHIRQREGRPAMVIRSLHDLDRTLPIMLDTQSS